MLILCHTLNCRTLHACYLKMLPLLNRFNCSSANVVQSHTIHGFQPEVLSSSRMRDIPNYHPLHSSFGYSISCSFSSTKPLMLGMSSRRLPYHHQNKSISNISESHQSTIHQCCSPTYKHSCQSSNIEHPMQHLSSKEQRLRSCCSTPLHGVHRYSSTNGMLGSKTPNQTEVFSKENKERIVRYLSSKRTPQRFYTRDINKRGAVFVPLCTVNGEPCILFTLRSKQLVAHSGEVSFPGGKMDPSDSDVCHTALREMKEELGIDPETVDVWGNLYPIGRSTINVVPIIGYLGEIDTNKLDFNTDEVSAVFVISLSQLCSPQCQSYTTYEPHEPTNKPLLALPVFTGGKHRVWGLTAVILDQALQVIVPEYYSSLASQVHKECGG